MTPAKALAQAKESDLKLFAWESETADPIWKILSKKGFSAGESPLNPVAEAVRRARGTWGARGAAPRGPASTRGEPSGLVLGSGGKGDSPALNPYLSHLGRAAQTVALFIGPEGGWSIKEVEMAKEAGFSLVGLGPYVLRAETAPIVACSMIHALLSLSA
ncbi:MAG: RNA methyltransferase [Elusimicrobia bacterium]|nr:RNA methyltransferase [Elusimicrobiota bacterium]